MLNYDNDQDKMVQNKIETKKWCSQYFHPRLLCPGSTAVEHSPRHPKVDASSPTPAAWKVLCLWVINYDNDRD
jgi:hypothetical protein